MAEPPADDPPQRGGRPVPLGGVLWCRGACHGVPSDLARLVSVGGGGCQGVSVGRGEASCRHAQSTLSPVSATPPGDGRSPGTPGHALMPRGTVEITHTLLT